MTTKQLGAMVTAVILLFVGIFTLFISMERVPQGYQGVIYSPSGVKSEPMSVGWKLLPPFDKVNLYPVKTRTVDYKNLNVATSDGKNLDMDLVVTYKVDPTKVVDLFNKFGDADIDSLENSYLKAQVLDNLRLTVSKYSVIETFGVKTGEIKGKTLKSIQDDLQPQGFLVDDIALSSPKADGTTQKAIDERVKAEQELQRAETDKKIATQNAQRKEIEARGEAKANEILNNSLTDKLIRKQMIDKWKGDQPLTIGSDSVIYNGN